MTLKPCPFCGAEAVNTPSSDNSEYWVCCTNPSCDMQPCVGLSNQQRAINAWNHRAPELTRNDIAAICELDGCCMLRAEPSTRAECARRIDELHAEIRHVAWIAEGRPRQLPQEWKD